MALFLKKLPLPILLNTMALVAMNILCLKESKLTPPQPKDIPMATSVVAYPITKKSYGGFTLAGAAAMTIWAARKGFMRFQKPTSLPKYWVRDIQNMRPLVTRLIKKAEHAQKNVTPEKDVTTKAIRAAHEYDALLRNYLTHLNWLKKSMKTHDVQPNQMWDRVVWPAWRQELRNTTKKLEHYVARFSMATTAVPATFLISINKTLTSLESNYGNSTSYPSIYHISTCIDEVIEETRALLDHHNSMQKAHHKFPELASPPQEEVAHGDETKATRMVLDCFQAAFNAYQPILAQWQADLLWLNKRLPRLPIDIREEPYIRPSAYQDLENVWQHRCHALHQKITENQQLLTNSGMSNKVGDRIICHNQHLVDALSNPTLPQRCDHPSAILKDALTACSYLIENHQMCEEQQKKGVFWEIGHGPHKSYLLGLYHSLLPASQPMMLSSLTQLPIQQVYFEHDGTPMFLTLQKCIRQLDQLTFDDPSLAKIHHDIKQNPCLLTPLLDYLNAQPVDLDKTVVTNLSHPPTYLGYYDQMESRIEDLFKGKGLAIHYLEKLPACPEVHIKKAVLEGLHMASFDSNTIVTLLNIQKIIAKYPAFKAFFQDDFDTPRDRQKKFIAQLDLIAGLSKANTSNLSETHQQALNRRSELLIAPLKKLKEELEFLPYDDLEKALKQTENIFDQLSQGDFLHQDQTTIGRNMAWIPKIVAAMDAHPTLVVVGQAHLYGKHGLIKLLQNQDGVTCRPNPEIRLADVGFEHPQIAMDLLDTIRRRKTSS